MGRLDEYAEISIAFEVVGRFDPDTLSVDPVARPWRKDYDAIETSGPRHWPKRFEVSKWGLFAAFVDDRRVGGATVARDTANMHMLDGRTDLAFLLDLRVDDGHRTQGVGRALVEAAEAWSVDCGLVEMKVETQDINSRACGFYEAMGFTLAEVDPNAYPDLPGETQIIWRKQLRSQSH